MDYFYSFGDDSDFAFEIEDQDLIDLGSLENVDCLHSASYFFVVADYFLEIVVVVASSAVDLSLLAVVVFVGSCFDFVVEAFLAYFPFARGDSFADFAS